MKITSLVVQQRDKSRVNVFTDGKYCLSLTLDQILSEKLKVGIDVDEQTIDRLQEISEAGKVRSRALEWVNMRPRSKKEFTDYMYRKKVDTALRDALLAEFTERKYINDEYFADWFAKLRMTKHKSKREIEHELKLKGVDSSIIKKIIFSEDYELESIKTLVAKLQKRSQYQDALKLKQYLFRKGYSIDLVKRAIDE